MIATGIILQNRYRIEKQIGQGGMGAVYVATDERFSSRVAIKETFFADERYGRAFEREAHLLNSLRHPALPRVSDHFAEQSGQFLVMEFIEGFDLSEKMRENKAAFALRDVLNWANQLLDALDYLHTQETPVIHRDIKPQNLKLNTRGQIILLDFGLAKGSPNDSSHLTAAPSVFGYSKNYASLEQMQGTGTDPRSDLYSLGATLYHLLTGVAPFDALTRAMTVLNGENDPLKPADLLHDQIPASVGEVLQRALALNANHRPASALAMRALLAESVAEITGDQAALNQGAVSNPLAQKTRKIGDARHSSETAQTARRTQNTPEAITGAAFAGRFKEQENKTKLNSAVEMPAALAVGQKRQSKNGLLVGAVLGGLLMAGSAAVLYFVKPDVFQRAAQTANANLENTNSAAQAAISARSVGNENSIVVSGDKNAAADAYTVAEKSGKKENAEKSALKSSVQIPAADRSNPKTAKPQPKSPVTATSEMGEDDVRVRGERIETRDVVIDNGRVIFKNPNERPRIQDGRPPLTVEQIKNLPPAERRRVRQILRRENLPEKQR